MDDSGVKEFSIITTRSGDILSSSGDVRGILNVSGRGLLGRNIFLFVAHDRMALERAVAALPQNVTLERDLLIQPKDRKAVLMRATITASADRLTLTLQLSRH